jgi:carboxypeptidase C (cathepsin A)
MRPWTYPRLALIVLLGIIVQGVTTRAAESEPESKPSDESSTSKHHTKPEPKHFKPEQQSSKGSVTVGGQRIDYDAYAGTLVVHPKDWDDVPQNAPPDEDKNPRPEASMFYVAYFKSEVDRNAGSARKSSEHSAALAGGAPERPITFIFNGGPGSATVWLHMGAWGPKRVVTADDTHTPAAPYGFVNNAYSLLDVSDLVFIDAPGAGFSRIAGKDREKAFYGVDPDAHAFANFIVQFLSKYGRWNSPKYIFGESYGTTRAAALINLLETEKLVDFNGVILLSQILNFDNSADQPELNPGIDLPYQLMLPSQAAAAWYHHKLPNQPAELAPLLKQVEAYAMNEYALALSAGANLSTEQRAAVAAKLHEFTGLPVDYILRADLRVNGPEFEQTLQLDTGTTTGRLDARFAGPTIDPLNKEADYDPLTTSIGSAYVSVFNNYVRKDLKYAGEQEFRPFAEIKEWDLKHNIPGGQPGQQQQLGNVMPDLAAAMKLNPGLHVMLNGGYFDIGTPYFEGIYEMQHLTIPASLQKNIEYAYYNSGHMVYAHEDALKQMHSKVADFIHRTSTPSAATAH